MKLTMNHNYWRGRNDEDASKKLQDGHGRKKIIVIICVVLTLVLGAAGAVFGYAASKVNKIQKIEVKKRNVERVYYRRGGA